MKGYIMNFFKRLKEPSSLAGLGGLAILFGVKPEAVGAVVDAVTALATAGTMPTPQTIVTAVGAVVSVGAVLVAEKK